MSKSLIYAVSRTTQTMLANENVSFNSVVRRFGCNCALSGGNIVISGPGYYNIDARVTFTPATTASNFTVSVLKDGAVIPGATASVSASLPDVYTLTVPCVARMSCGCESTITVRVSDDAVVSNAAIVVEKV